LIFEFLLATNKNKFLMSWRDPRLVSSLTTILVKEEEILEKIWRPDP